MKLVVSPTTTYAGQSSQQAVVKVTRKNNEKLHTAVDSTLALVGGSLPTKLGYGRKCRSIHTPGATGIASHLFHQTAQGYIFYTLHHHRIAHPLLVDVDRHRSLIWIIS